MGLLLFTGAAVPALSFLPPGVKHLLHTRGILHPWYHLVAFAALTFIFLRNAKTLYTRLLCIAGAVLMGCGTEIAQSIVYHYPVERLDIIADTIGVVCSAVMMLVPASRMPYTARDFFGRWINLGLLANNPTR